MYVVVMVVYGRTFSCWSKAMQIERNPFENAALMRLACTGITLRQAQNMDDTTLLRFPLIGRKTLRYVRETTAKSVTD
jgi:hypothetical protein